MSLLGVGMPKTQSHRPSMTAFTPVPDDSVGHRYLVFSVNLSWLLQSWSSQNGNGDVRGLSLSFIWATRVKKFSDPTKITSVRFVKNVLWVYWNRTKNAAQENLATPEAEGSKLTFINLPWPQSKLMADRRRKSSSQHLRKNTVARCRLRSKGDCLDPVCKKLDMWSFSITITP